MQAQNLLFCLNVWRRDNPDKAAYSSSKDIYNMLKSFYSMVGAESTYGVAMTRAKQEIYINSIIYEPAYSSFLAL